ncbi:MAG: ABC transporter ATP-binding protein/permease [Desulfotignum sp.]|nr:ABC transporter ATP-binding protein/permease [Desulfotignum sp.]
MKLEEKEIRLADLVLAKALWPFIRPYAWLLVCSTLLVFAGIFFELSIPLLIQKGLDGFVLGSEDGSGASFLGFHMTQFKGFAVFFSLVILAAFVIDFGQTLFMEYSGQKIILHLRCALFSHMTGLPVAYYDKTASGRLVARVAGDIENMNEMFTSVLVFIFKDLVLMAAIFVMLAMLNPGLAFYLFLLVPVILMSVTGFSRRVRNVFRTIRQKIGEINHSFSEAISGIRIIQTTGSKDTFVNRFRQLNETHFTAAMFQIKIFAVFMPFIGFLGTISTAIILWVGSSKVMSHQMTIGELVAFLTYMKLFFRPLRELSEKFNLLQNALASAERIITVLEKPRDLQRITKKRTRLDTIDRLAFDHVDFSYDGETPVLKKICFDLQKGESIGIVGQTGSGKTSIINLITGFYRPDTGHILINNQAMDAINIMDIRKKTALVMQDPILFSGSVRDNVCPPEKPLNVTALKKVLEQANCHFLYDRFTGPDTLLKEGGRPLSAGEKQLVCIARAFACDPDLIIFDEATSYMDSGSEQAVHEAMNRLMHGRMSIVIAHRLSTIRHCGHIMLLRNGRIREQGSHQELVMAKGEYFHLLEKETL